MSRTKRQESQNIRSEAIVPLKEQTFSRRIIVYAVLFVIAGLCIHALPSSEAFSMKVLFDGTAGAVTMVSIVYFIFAWRTTNLYFDKSNGNLFFTRPFLLGFRQKRNSVGRPDLVSVTRRPYEGGPMSEVDVDVRSELFHTDARFSYTCEGTEEAFEVAQKIADLSGAEFIKEIRDSQFGRVF